MSRSDAPRNIWEAAFRPLPRGCAGAKLPEKANFDKAFLAWEKKGGVNRVPMKPGPTPHVPKQKKNEDARRRMAQLRANKNKHKVPKKNGKKCS